MSMVRSPDYEPGLQANPTVVELTRLSAHLREIWEYVAGEHSWANWLRAAIEGRINHRYPDHGPPILANPPAPTCAPTDESDSRHDDDLQANMFCGLLFKSAKQLDEDAQRAESVIMHKLLKAEVITALIRIRDAILI